MARVEPLRVAAVEALHAGGELGDGCVHDQVVVRAQYAEREDGPAEVVDVVKQKMEEAAAVEVVAERRRGIHAARPDMEEPVGKQSPQLASHLVRR